MSENDVLFAATKSAIEQRDEQLRFIGRIKELVASWKHEKVKKFIEAGDFGQSGGTAEEYNLTCAPKCHRCQMEKLLSEQP